MSDVPVPLHVYTQCSTYIELRRFVRAVTKIYDRKMAKVGLGAAQYSTLTVIAELNPIGFKALANILTMDVSTLSRNVKVLVRSGWVENLPGQDRRHRSVIITKEGIEKIRLAEPQWLAAEEYVRNNFPLVPYKSFNTTFTSSI